MFPPLFFASGPIFVGTLIAAQVFKKKDNNAHKQLFNLSVDFEKYRDQMKFLEELTNLVKEYYEPIFKESELIGYDTCYIVSVNQEKAFAVSEDLLHVYQYNEKDEEWNLISK